MSNYPPGVTGNEFEIAGPDYERESDEPCPHYMAGQRQECGLPTMEQGYRNDSWLVCEEGHVTDLEPLEPDPDRAHDEAVERRLFEEEK